MSDSRSHDAQRIGAPEDFDDVAEVFGVRPDEDGYAELRGLQTLCPPRGTRLPPMKARSANS